MTSLEHMIAELIYQKRIFTYPAGQSNIQVPVLAPNAVRYLLQRSFGSVGSYFKHLSSDFPFKIVWQRGLTKTHLYCPPNATWWNFVGEGFKANNTSAYAFVPKEFSIKEEDMKAWVNVSHNLNWWPAEPIKAVAHLYDRPEQNPSPEVKAKGEEILDKIMKKDLPPAPSNQDI